MGGEASIALQNKGWLYHPDYPDHWERCPLYSMARWVNGLAFRDIHFSASGMPVIKIAEIKGGISGQTKFTQQTFDESVRVRPGDLLFSWSGQPETSIDAFWWRGPEGWLNQHVFRVTPAYGVDPTFLYYLLRYLKPNFVGIARNKQTTGLGHVTKRDLENIEAAYPELPEQRAIAHILGALDDKIELNRRMNETLEAMARAIFKSWFVDFLPVRAKAEGRDPGLPQHLADLFPDRFEDSELGEIPKGWRAGALCDFFEVGLGGAWGEDQPSERASVRTRCLRGIDCHDLAEGRIPNVPVRWLSSGQVAGRHLVDGTVLIEGSGSFCGRSLLWHSSYGGLIGDPVGYSNFCKRLDPLCTTSQAVVCWLQMRKAYRDGELQAFRTGTAFPNFDVHGALANLFFVVPPDAVADAFSKFFWLSRRLDLMAQSRTLAALRDTLLPKLISGELRVKGAERIARQAEGLHHV